LAVYNSRGQRETFYQVVINVLVRSWKKAVDKVEYSIEKYYVLSNVGVKFYELLCSITYKQYEIKNTGCITF
jgi:hypothetical protein